MDFNYKIIQWNCRGLKPNYNEVSLLISEYNPSVFCFQETFLKPDDNTSLRGLIYITMFILIVWGPLVVPQYFKPSINKYISEEWQTSWNKSIGNKLLDIKPTIGEYQSVVRNIRREEVVLARLRLGHTRVTHSYLLQGEEHPQCVGCDAPFTVRHFLLECGDFAQVRNNCFHVNNMKELFQDIHIDSIMTFLRQINLFNKI